jgi:phosphohistidine phosphatase
MTDEKILFIVRHGKSSWDYPAVSDIDRSLKERGIKDAYDMAKRVLKKAYVPECIISSPALRALHTAIIFSRVLGFPVDEIIINQDLYLSEADKILSVITATDDSLKSLMVFGHNPGFTELVNYLSELDIDNLPTSGVVILRFNTEKWKGINKNCQVVEFFDYPHNT